MSPSAVFPRSNISTDSVVGSSHSHSHFFQSSARTTAAQTSFTSSQECRHSGPIARSATPPHPSDPRLTSRTSSFPDGGSVSAADQRPSNYYIANMNLLLPDRAPFAPSQSRFSGPRSLPQNSILKARGRVLFPSDSGGSLDIPLAYRILTRDKLSRQPY